MKTAEILAVIAGIAGMIVMKGRRRWPLWRKDWTLLVGIVLCSYAGAVGGLYAITSQWLEQAWWGRIILIVLYGLPILLGVVATFFFLGWMRAKSRRQSSEFRV